MKTTAIKSKPGIRIKENGKFIVFKSVAGKRVTREFKVLSEAVAWKKDTSSYDASVNGKNPALSGQGEGRNEIYFRDVYAQYLAEGMIGLTEYTVYKKKLRMSKFMPNILGIKMSEFNGRVLLKHISDMLLLVGEDSKRCNFDKELKDLSSILRWYDNEVTPFPCPIKRKHYDAGKIKPVLKKKKNIPPEALPEAGIHMRKMIRHLTVMQFLLGSRVGEVCALNDRTVDFRAGEIDLCETITWMKGKPSLRQGTKTDVENRKTITPLMKGILLELKNERPKGCTYFFQHKGKPLRYGMILKELNHALSLAGYGEFSGTHIIRYAMATFSRKEGGLDIAQAMLAHADARMTEGYAKLDVNKKVTDVAIKAENIFRLVQPPCNQEEKLVI